jgi:septal ring factor EnvC (AmiA/AmiB activator)
MGAHDLFVGISLAHEDRETNTARTLLEHFGIPLGAVVAGIYRPPFDAHAIAAARDRVPMQGYPRDRAVEDILDAAQGSDIIGGAGTVPLNGLLLPLIDGTNPVAETIRVLLQRQGVEPHAVVASLAEYARSSSRPTIKAFLEDRHSWPPQVRLPPYAADRPGERGSDGLEAGAAGDLLEIGAEVDALAYLMCSTKLEPPLAVGLFGDWGSGKSFFMRALQRRVDAITKGLRDRGAAQTDFFTSIVQIEFNAWHYVEGNLWASLVEHIFRNLRQHADEGEAEVRERRELILQRIAKVERSAEDARRDITRLDKEVRSARNDLQRLTKERDAAQQVLDHLRSTAPGEGAPPAALQTSAGELLDEVGRQAPDGSLDESIAVLADARRSLRSVGGLTRILGRSGPGWQLLLLLILAIAAAPLVSWALDAAGASSVTNALTSIGAAFAAAVGALRRGGAVVDDVARRLEHEETRFRQELEDRRRSLDDQVDSAARDLDDKERELGRARDVVADRERERADLERELDVIPTRLLAEFIDERIGSDDYRRHLGLPALIRRDFDRLWRLIAGYNAQVLDPDRTPQPEDEPLMNRIVLYIDDLDRCPAQRVTEVLQAVHLLLAFPLFVVVVAVDSRWLAGSLRRRYGDLFHGVAESAAKDGRARPDDYMEKIFQIPFRIQRIENAQRKRMLHGALDAVVEVAEAGVVEEPGRRGPGPDRVDPVLVSELFRVEPERRPSVAAQALTITAAELEFMDRVAPLLGETPRSVKRFTNVYLLLKSIARHSGQAPSAPNDDALIFLLALATGHPELAADLLDEIERGETATLGDTGAATRAGSALERWLAAETDWRSVPLATLEPLAQPVARFSFVGVSG